MSEEVSRYELRGVSAKKEAVHKAIRNLDKGLFPNAFCKILPDLVGGNAGHCNVMHADTAGTKTALAYLYWKETGDMSVWPGIIQDALVMNLDDMACVGITDQIVISSTIGRNKHNIPDDVVGALIHGTSLFIEKMARLGIHLELAGGETADVGDIVRTLDVGFTTFARCRRDEIIVNQMQAGDVIVGFSSFGKASYEEHENSGIGSNGLTSARHDVLSKYLAIKYPEAFDPATPESLIFSGNKKLSDAVEGSDLTVGQLLLSPTRTYLPLLKNILKKHRKVIHGMIHCTGGGQSKVLHFADQIHIVKNNLFPIPAVFRLIQQESNAAWSEMYRVFNMGHRLEIYTDEGSAHLLIEEAGKLNIEAKIIGYTEVAETKLLTITNEFGSWHYNS